MMKNKKLHTIILPLCTLLLFSCTQDTISPASDSENEIRFQTGTPTRGLIDNLAVGSEICLYGYHDGAYLAAGNDDKKLAGKTLKYLNTDRWSVVNGDNPLTYFWEGEGNYRFFGWLKQDPNGPIVDGNPTVLEAPQNNWITRYENETLTVEATLDQSYNQFDFMYSEVNKRTLDENNKREPVELNMHHLFSAFSIGISNTSQDNITVKSIKLQRLHSTGTATINFNTGTASTTVSNTPPTVVYSNYPNATANSTDNLASYQDNTGYTLNGTKVVANGTSKPNIFDPNDTQQRYYMVWPQAENVIRDQKFDEELTPEEENGLDDAYFPLIMQYYVGDDAKDVLTKRMKFPKMAWAPGKKYNFEVMIADKIVEITATVSEWNYSSSDVDFRDQSVSIKENGHLQYDDSNNKCTIDRENKIVYVENGQPVEATFCLDTPQGGQWEVSLEGDVTSFQIIDDAAPTNDGIGPIDGKIHRIKIVPIVNSPTSDHKVRLKFIAKSADGKKTFNADDVLQDDPENDDDEHEADIYTIILRKV